MTAHTPTVDEPILARLRTNLRKAGPGRWGAIAEVAGVGKTLPRKIAYGDRLNPGVETIQPLVTYFARVERGELRLPELEVAR